MQAANPRRWSALAVIALAQFMVIMDTSIIGVALPEIQADVGFTPDTLSWVFNAYVIAFGGLLLLGGRLSDLYGAAQSECSAPAGPCSPPDRSPPDSPRPRPWRSQPAPCRAPVPR
jgi:MFS family permease